MSIVRVGLGETKKFAEGYEAIFGKKNTREDKAEKAQKPAKNSKRKAGKRKK